MLKWFKTYVLSLRKDIVSLLICDCVFLLVMDLWLRRIPAPFPIFVKIGDVLVTLGISFLASFIFYFVQVHLPEARLKKDLYPVISELFHRIIFTERSFLTEFVGVKPFELLTEENIKAGIIARDVNIQNAPLHLAGLNRRANWMEYGLNQVAEIDKTWEMLMKYSAYMDSELLSLLSRIQGAGTLGFFRKMKGIYPSLKQGLKLSGFEDGFVELWHFIQEQYAYFDKVFSEYRRA